jgi:hypothetical protein
LSHPSHPRSVQLEVRACEMRLSPTLSEARLWQALRGSRLGVAFRRQAVIGDYIVDFLAPAASLVVEVDGGYHGRRRRADAGAIECSSGQGIGCCVSRGGWSWPIYRGRYRSSSTIWADRRGYGRDDPDRTMLAAQWELERRRLRAALSCGERRVRPRDLRGSEGALAWCHMTDGMLSLTRAWSITGAAHRPDRL